MDPTRIIIVVPVFNEQDSLEGLHAEITQTSKGLGHALRVVFVDDGSTDASWERIRALAEHDQTVGGLRFRRNAGKAAALMAGFSVAGDSDVVITMDADLQDPPEEIPRLLARLEEGYDMVSGWKLKRLDPWHKVYPSRIFNRLVSGLTGVRLHDHVCGLKAYRTRVIPDLKIWGDLHRFLAVFAAAAGHRVTEIPTRHRPRITGRGKYGFSRFAKALVDLGTVLLLTRFRWRPQHLIGVIGLWIIVAALFLMALEAAVGPSLLLWLLLAGVAVPACGLTLIAIGWLAALMVGERAVEGQYEIVERIGWCR